MKLKQITAEEWFRGHIPRELINTTHKPDVNKIIISEFRRAFLNDYLVYGLKAYLRKAYETLINQSLTK